ncbi:MAG: DUF1211 domain-containing protein [Anaerolineales bacterium]|uniref:TMEM175 family protein n=1 Tax=Candidatus Villigracilis proximus TaxID=3140683 RepID=UPI003134D7F5|nr:DUF1211 domain-containing protein [Anaerolineales bacterium]
MTKSRLEAFSDGMFAIILTILVLELKVPELENSTFAVFLEGMKILAPKFISFLFSFFIIAIFWVNHHHILHKVHKVDSIFLWLNVALLFLHVFSLSSPPSSVTISATRLLWHCIRSTWRYRR